MRICLVNSPRFNCRPARKSSVPYSLACLAAVAKQAGHDAAVVDGMTIGAPKAVAGRAAAFEPDVVGVTTNTNDRFATLRTIRLIRRAAPTACIVVGGHHFSHTAADALAVVPEIDAVVVGEGEETFLDLLERLPGRDGLGEVRGLVWRDGERIVPNQRRPVMPGLNHLPMPAWDLFDMSAYDLHMVGGGTESLLGVMTTRGCPYNCVFCGSSLGGRVRFLDPKLAVDQLEVLHKDYGMTGFRVFDDSFLARKSHAIAVCEEILRRRLRVTWWANARAQRLDPEVLALMRRSGCTAISFGVETGTDEVLTAANKGVTCDEMLEAFARVAEAGFEHVHACLILGLPGETPDTIERTQAFLAKLQALVPDAFHCDSLIGHLPLIYPGTQLERMAKEEGCLPEDFSWNAPYRMPKPYLPLINRRYYAVPHYESRSFPLEAVCRHMKQHHWDKLSAGRRKRYRLAPLRRVLCAPGLR